ncbi:hypothetical protein [Thiocapsa sp.]|uniref:hypothetical protein n=1 Tax=Thiocapsa sp. TaxID=2024551 RepID=UPI002C1C4A2F|nr:hypothetical protein [Thiocapsa sp.]HSO81517.1 hypothetical protein [Thiocapsa sp.]
MLVWQLLQVRHLRDTPLIFVGEMWFELVEWATRHMLRPGSELANPEDLTIPRCVKTADEAIALLEGQHAHWQKNITPPRSDSDRDDSAL